MSHNDARNCSDRLLVKGKENMRIRSAVMNGRKGWELSNDVLSLFVMSGGGHIAGLKAAGTKAPNPFWSPVWKTIEPWQYRKRDAARFGCRMLSCIYGHNLCLGWFGDPSAEETRAGLDSHGEAPVARWRRIGGRAGARRLSFTYGCELPVARMRFARRISMEAGSRIARVSEQIVSVARCDAPFTMCQHVTFGPPFLEPGVTIFDMSGTRGRTFSGEFSQMQRMKSDAAFMWPDGPGRKGKLDLRFLGAGGNSDFVCVEMDRKMEHAWFSAVNPRQGLLIAYIWRRSDYPWTGVWEESFARKQRPWNGKTLARGMEFANSPFPIGLRKSVDIGSLDGLPTFRWLPALGSLRFNYAILALPVDSDCAGVAEIRQEGGDFIVSLISR